MTAVPTDAPSAARTRRKRGLLRYNADWLSVAWVQSALLLSLLPWFVHLPWWALALLVFPLYHLRSGCGYIQHNQGHLHIFWGAPLNFLLDIELALTTGYVTPLWELQHSRGHHRHYLTPEKDPATIIDLRTGKPMPRWQYCLFGNLTIIQDSWRIAREEVDAGRADLRPRMVGEFVVASALTAFLCYLNPALFVGVFLIPNIIGAWTVWHISYEHHHDVPGSSHYDGSHTHLGRAFNRMRFNLGHHAAHHEKPTLHWTLLPQRSAQILERLDPVTVHGELDDAARAPEIS